jgi:hypothetical protein
MVCQKPEAAADSAETQVAEEVVVGMTTNEASVATNAADLSGSGDIVHPGLVILVGTACYLGRRRGALQSASKS